MDMSFRIILLTLILGLLVGCSSSEVSLEEKIGQIMMVGFRGETLDESDPIISDIRDHHIGGVILYGVDVALGQPTRNISSPPQLSRLTSALQSYAPGTLLIAIDQEGGLVNRLKPEFGFYPTYSHQALGAKDNVGFTYDETCRLAAALKESGVNLNLAPVVDVAISPDNFIVKKERTFSSDPDAVIRHAMQYILAHRSQGVLCTLKHFPGHGSSATDSHKGMVDITDTWQEKELEPYYLLAPKSDVVMTAHVFHRDLDPDWPATLSKKMINDLLREKIGFEGVVMSDDLGMAPIVGNYGLETALERSLNAGVDILLISNNTEYDPYVISTSVRTIIKLVKCGRVSEERIDEAYQRVMRLKHKLLL
jgi:beta-N-acetylhexosaminidase